MIFSAGISILRKSGGTPRLQDLAVHADTVVDIAETLSAERNDTSSKEVFAWAVASQASIVSHRREKF